MRAQDIPQHTGFGLLIIRHHIHERQKRQTHTCPRQERHVQQKQLHAVLLRQTAASAYGRTYAFLRRPRKQNGRKRILLIDNGSRHDPGQKADRASGQRGSCCCADRQTACRPPGSLCRVRKAAASRLPCAYGHPKTAAPLESLFLCAASKRTADGTVPSRMHCNTSRRRVPAAPIPLLRTTAAAVRSVPRRAGKHRMGCRKTPAEDNRTRTRAERS